MDKLGAKNTADLIRIVFSEASARRRLSAPHPASQILESITFMILDRFDSIISSGRIKGQGFHFGLPRSFTRTSRRFAQTALNRTPSV
jgi:hypothetical protein